MESRRGYRLSHPFKDFDRPAASSTYYSAALYFLSLTFFSLMRTCSHFFPLLPLGLELSQLFLVHLRHRLQLQHFYSHQLSVVSQLQLGFRSLVQHGRNSSDDAGQDAEDGQPDQHRPLAHAENTTTSYYKIVPTTGLSMTGVAATTPIARPLGVSSISLSLSSSPAPRSTAPPETA